MQWIIQQNKKDENKSKAAAVKVNKINLKKTRRKNEWQKLWNLLLAQEQFIIKIISLKV